MARSAWDALNDAWGPMTIDHFATPLDTHLPRFNSAMACPGAERVDAHTAPWWGETNYCAPPFSHAPAALRKCFKDRATAIFVLPVWPAHPWWRRATTRTHAAVLLPDDAIIYTSGRFTPPAKPPSWQMAAFLFENGGTPTTGPRGDAWPTIRHWPPSARPVPALRSPPRSLPTPSPPPRPTRTGDAGRSSKRFAPPTIGKHYRPPPPPWRVFLGTLCERRLAPSSLQTYLTPINNRHRDGGFDKPATGPLIAKLRTGCNRMLADEAAEFPPTRAALPATVVWRTAQLALDERNAAWATRFTAVVL